MQCSTRCAKPSGGKRLSAVLVVISDTASAERAVTRSAKGWNQRVLVGPQTDREQPAAGVAASTGIDALGAELRQQGRIVGSRPESELERVPIGVGRRVRGQDARSGVRRPSGEAGVNEGHRRPAAGQLEGQRESHQTSTDHNHIAVRGAHGGE